MEVNMKPEHNEYYDQKTLFITGFAGSGKSTEIAAMAGPTTLILVPTHKAADVLIGKGLKNVYTIHSVLKLVPTINQNFRKKMQTKLHKVGATDLTKITSIIIDEFSMINEEILNLLMAVLPAKATVTIVGDPYQLPPISGDPIIPWEPILELSTQHRSKNVAGTNMFMGFMHAIRDYKPSPNLSYVTHGTLDRFNPETDRILAFTNKRVVELNKLVSGQKEFQDNDELTVNGLPCLYGGCSENLLFPSCVAKGKLLPPTKLKSAADKCLHDIAKWHTNLGMYKRTTIQIDNQGYTIYYDPDHYSTEQRLKKDVEKYQGLVIKENNLSLSDNIPDWCRANRGGAYVMERGKAWSKYLSHKNYVFNLAYPFATTVHKAQGSEFSKVFIDQVDMSKALNTEQYQRLMYVALSRAIDEVIFI